MRNTTNASDAPGKSLLWDKLNRISYLPGLMLCIIGISLTVAAAAPSRLDSAFGVLGKVVSSPDGSQTTAGIDMALQPDGKIVVLGNRVQSSQYAGMIVARYNADGSPDTNFGNNGWTSATFGAGWEFAVAVAIQPDGKIVVGGTIRNVVNNVPSNDFAVLRLNPNGSPDTSFDGDGKLIIDFNPVLPGAYTEYLSALEVAGDGKIVVAGQAAWSTVNDRFILARINPDGSPDTSFDGDGKLVDEPWASNLDRINDMVILPDGKIVVAGQLVTFVGGFRIAVRYSANGVKEWTYTAGTQSNVPNDNEALNGIAALPDGKFIVVGKRQSRIVALRLNADGSEDNTFVSPAEMPVGQALSVAVQADGKILAAIEGSSFSLVRFNANGSLDTAFGVGGFVGTDVSEGQDYGRKVLIQPDGKILVGGSSTLSSPTRYYFSMVRYLGASAAAYNPLFDYDGDGKADVSVFRPSDGIWYLNRSSGGFTAVQFGTSGDLIAPADYDGDGKTDICVFRPSDGGWYRLNSSNNTFTAAQFGASADLPVPADFDGDRKADLTVYRPSAGSWYRIDSSSNQFVAAQFGTAEDKPLAGDFDGDGKSDLTVFRPSNGTWYRIYSSTGAFSPARFGAPGDLPVPADYDGDGKTDLAVYRPSVGDWYVINSGSSSFTGLHFGVTEDKPVPADFDGDGKADVAVFRPSAGTWYLLRSQAGFTGFQFGTSGDIPTPNAFVR